MRGVMRPGQTGRSYGRNNGNNSYRARQQIPNRSQTLDSNGPNALRELDEQAFRPQCAIGWPGNGWPPEKVSGLLQSPFGVELK
jgi:hypothetical protein